MIIKELQCANCRNKLVENGKEIDSFVLVCNKCIGDTLNVDTRIREELKSRLRITNKENKRILKLNIILTKFSNKDKEQIIFLNELLDKREEELKNLEFVLHENSNSSPKKELIQKDDEVANNSMSEAKSSKDALHESKDDNNVKEVSE